MLSAHTQQYLNQLGGLLVYVDVEDSGRAVAYKMVPCSHWHNHNAFPEEVTLELKSTTFRVTTVEGLDYYLIPETTINAIGEITQIVHAEPSPVPVDTKAPQAQAKYLRRENKASKVTSTE